MYDYICMIIYVYTYDYIYIFVYTYDYILCMYILRIICVCRNNRNYQIKINATDNIEQVIKIIIPKPLCQLPGAATSP